MASWNKNVYCIHLILALELNFLATMSFFGLDDNMMIKKLRVLCILIIFLPTLHSPEVVIQYPQICMKLLFNTLKYVQSSHERL